MTVAESIKKIPKEERFMERYAWKAQVREGMLEEYIRRHDEIWPEMKQMLREAMGRYKE